MGIIMSTCNQLSNGLLCHSELAGKLFYSPVYVPATFLYSELKFSWFVVKSYSMISMKSEARQNRHDGVMARDWLTIA